MVPVFRLIDSDMVYSFGSHEPGLRVNPGDVIELTTEDCFGGLVRTSEDLPSQVCTFPYLNPVTAPIYIEGAEVGDTLHRYSTTCGLGGIQYLSAFRGADGDSHDGDAA